jgi:hypothetical protein
MRIALPLLALGCSQPGRTPGYSGSRTDQTGSTGAAAIEQVPGGQPHWVVVDSASSHTCGLLSNGTATCWGSDYSAALHVPPGLYLDITAGSNFSCGRTEDEITSCWGCFGSDDEDLGKACSQQPPAGLMSLEAGAFHACGLDVSGNLECWGFMTYQMQPEYPGPFLWTAMGDEHHCTLDPKGTPQCYGAMGIDPETRTLGAYYQPPPPPVRTSSRSRPGTIPHAVSTKTAWPNVGAKTLRVGLRRFNRRPAPSSASSMGGEGTLAAWMRPVEQCVGATT